MKPMIAHPTTTAMIRFSLRSRRRCFFRWWSIRSACSGLKSECMRGAVAPGSELGLSNEYVRGMVMSAVMVSTKKGKNWPY